MGLICSINLIGFFCVLYPWIIVVISNEYFNDHDLLDELFLLNWQTCTYGFNKSV